jgi:pimeloyl-ACP methyl ester carboxylesterase
MYDHVGGSEIGATVYTKDTKDAKGSKTRALLSSGGVAGGAAWPRFVVAVRDTMPRSFSGLEEQMYKVTIALAIALAAVATPTGLTAQVTELPNVPIVSNGWQEKFWTHSDGTKFHYLEWGKGIPVILIHGSGGTALNWMANGLGASLARTNRVLAIDMRGHGQTVGPDGKRQQRTPNMDLDVLAFMDAMGIQKAHIGGFSMGGAITGQLMARAPERFISAHFGGSGVREEPGSEFAKLIPPDPKGTAPLDAEARRLYEARQKAEAAKAGVANGATDSSQLSSQPVPVEVPRPALDLTKIGFPILAVVGEFDQPYTRTHRLWREAPNLQRVILRNRGHLSSYMAGLCPELYRDALTDFVVRNNPKH